MVFLGKPNFVSIKAVALEKFWPNQKSAIFYLIKVPFFEKGHHCSKAVAFLKGPLVFIEPLKCPLSDATIKFDLGLKAASVWPHF